MTPRLKSALQRAMRFVAPKDPAAPIVVTGHREWVATPYGQAPKIPGTVSAWDGTVGVMTPLSPADHAPVDFVVAAGEVKTRLPNLASSSTIESVSGSMAMLRSEHAKIPMPIALGGNGAHPFVEHFLKGRLRGVQLFSAHLPWLSALLVTASRDEVERADLTRVCLTAHKMSASDEVRTTIVFADAAAPDIGLPDAGLLLPRRLFSGIPDRVHNFDLAVWQGWVLLHCAEDRTVRFCAAKPADGFYDLEKFMPTGGLAVTVDKGRLQQAIRFVLTTSPQDVAELVFDRAAKTLAVRGISGMPGGGISIDTIPVEIDDTALGMPGSSRVLVRGRVLFEILKAWRGDGQVRVRYGTFADPIVLETVGGNHFRSSINPLLVQDPKEQAA